MMMPHVIFPFELRAAAVAARQQHKQKKKRNRDSKENLMDEQYSTDFNSNVIKSDSLVCLNLLLFLRRVGFAGETENEIERREIRREWASEPQQHGANLPRVNKM